MGDSHHVLSAGGLVHEFLADNAAPTLHYVGGYIGLRISDPYFDSRVAKLEEAGRIGACDALIVFIGTNDAGFYDANPDQVQGNPYLSDLETLKIRAGDKLLLIGPTQDTPQAAYFYATANEVGLRFIDARMFEKSGDNVHLSPRGYADLAIRIKGVLRATATPAWSGSSDGRCVSASAEEYVSSGAQ